MILYDILIQQSFSDLVSFSFEVFAPLWLAALALAALAAVAVVVPAIAETHLPPGNVERRECGDEVRSHSALPGPTRSNQVRCLSQSLQQLGYFCILISLVSRFPP